MSASLENSSGKQEMLEEKFSLQNVIELKLNLKQSYTIFVEIYIYLILNLQRRGKDTANNKYRTAYFSYNHKDSLQGNEVKITNLWSRDVWQHTYLIRFTSFSYGYFEPKIICHGFNTIHTSQAKENLP